MTEINYEEAIGQWHRDRNLIDGSSVKDQYMNDLALKKLVRC